MFNHEVSVSRLTDGTGGRRVYGVASGEVFCFIEPVDVETAQASGYNLEKTYLAYFAEDNVDVLVGDKLTDQDSNEYTVKGITRFKHAGSVSHATAVLEAV